MFNNYVQQLFCFLFYFYFLALCMCVVEEVGCVSDNVDVLERVWVCVRVCVYVF